MPKAVNHSYYTINTTAHCAIRSRTAVRHVTSRPLRLAFVSICLVFINFINFIFINSLMISVVNLSVSLIDITAEGNKIKILYPQKLEEGQ